MNSGFNLSPVIGLLRVLPTEASSTAGSFGPYTKPNTESKEHSRQLGDFTELWRFLETTADVNGASTTVAQDCQTDYSYISPVPEPDVPPQVPGSFKKPRRVVTFAATVGLSDDVDSTKTHISTRFKTGLDDNGVKTFVGLMSRPVIKSSATPEARKIKIIQTLMTMFPETKKTLLRPTTSAELAPDGVHVFVDNSNVCDPICALWVTCADMYFRF